MPGFDAIASGFGGETSDSLVVNVSSKPVWRLKPLPLSQVNPDHAEAPARVGPPPSLQSSCLDTISTYFHEYAPDALAGLPPAHVQRIIAKVRSDRLHPELDTSYRPDEATVWVYSVLADPEGTEQDMTLGLHPTTLLRQLPPNQALNPPDHPFIQLPKLYASLQPDSAFTLMTTLKLDGAATHVRDDNIMTLRYATNLTVLSIKGCDEVSDSAVRLLSSALILPGERGGDGAGMWRLRAWFMHGCTKITDKSMRALARWPGLVALGKSICRLTLINRYTKHIMHLDRPANLQQSIAGPVRLSACRYAAGERFSPPAVCNASSYLFDPRESQRNLARQPFHSVSCPAPRAPLRHPCPSRPSRTAHSTKYRPLRPF